MIITTEDQGRGVWRHDPRTVIFTQSKISKFMPNHTDMFVGIFLHTHKNETLANIPAFTFSYSGPNV
jgi:hypothetical protein